MKKFWKRFAVIASILCLAVTACALFAACGGNEDTDNGIYTITVVTPEGTGVQGVKMKLCTVDEQGNELTCKLFTTDANGKVVAEMTPDNYHVSLISGIPEDYSATEYMDGVSKLYTKDFTKNAFTITLKQA